MNLNFSRPSRRQLRIAVGATLLASACAGTILGLPAFARSDQQETGTQYDADNDMQRVLDAYRRLGPQPIQKLTVEQARKQPTPADAVNAVLEDQGKPLDPGKLVPGVSARDTIIAGVDGSLPVRIYTPQGKGPFPVIVYYHGGGWVLADKEVYDGGARGLAKQAQAVVVSVDYRRAPEHPFPAAWDDALAAYEWVAQNAESIDGDPQRLALAGESAGGNLAVSTAIAARKAGMTPPRHVLAIYPVAQTGNLDTPSYRDSAEARPLSRPMIGWFLDKVFARPADKADPRVDLVSADLSGLPPVTIINAQIDPLRSDGELLEDALERAGVDVEREVYKGTTHEFFGAAAVVDDARQAQRYAATRLKEAFGRASDSTAETGNKR